MTLSTLNGCTCHHLSGAVCVACCGRALGLAKGYWCLACGVGLQEGVERSRKRCTECFYESPTFSDGND